MSSEEDSQSCADMSREDLAELISCLDDNMTEPPSITESETVILNDYHLGGQREQSTKGATVPPENRLSDTMWQNEFLRDFNAVRCSHHADICIFLRCRNRDGVRVSLHPTISGFFHIPRIGFVCSIAKIREGNPSFSDAGLQSK